MMLSILSSGNKNGKYLQIQIIISKFKTVDWEIRYSISYWSVGLYYTPFKIVILFQPNEIQQSDVRSK